MLRAYLLHTLRERCHASSIPPAHGDEARMGRLALFAEGLAVRDQNEGQELAATRLPTARRGRLTRPR